VNHDLPTLNELGRDLLRVNRGAVFLSLLFPFLLTSSFFLFVTLQWWIPALACPVLLSFFTYGSISHDLVHRNLGLPRRLNDLLLCLIELLTLRSGHAYRNSHLNHHARFPAKDDLEGAAAGMSLGQALLDGITLQGRIWIRALRHNRTDRHWILGEGLAVAGILGSSLAAIPWTFWPAVYCGLVIGGSWMFPFVTSWIPHDASGDHDLSQTRLFRGRLISLLALEHLYHLEHHLFPQVPHHRWPELARRLDPHFQRLGIKAVKLWF
jgi:beta-carotene hydroxylase